MRFHNYHKIIWLDKFNEFITYFCIFNFNTDFREVRLTGEGELVLFQPFPHPPAPSPTCWRGGGYNRNNQLTQTNISIIQL